MPLADLMGVEGGWGAGGADGPEEPASYPPGPRSSTPSTSLPGRGLSR